MKVVQFSRSGSSELHVSSKFLLGRIVRSQTVFSIRKHKISHQQKTLCSNYRTERLSLEIMVIHLQLVL
jgi:hypothetical protein